MSHVCNDICRQEKLNWSADFKWKFCQAMIYRLFSYTHLQNATSDERRKDKNIQYQSLRTSAIERYPILDRDEGQILETGERDHHPSCPWLLINPISYKHASSESKVLFVLLWADRRSPKRINHQTFPMSAPGHWLLKSRLPFLNLYVSVTVRPEHPVTHANGVFTFACQ